MASLNLDGWGNGYAPDEEQEPKSYFSELEYYKTRLAESKRTILWYSNQLKRLAEIEGSQVAFGALSVREQQEKQEILEKYL